MGGIHFSERKYYDDPEENANFIKYYASSMYCPHGQPTYHPCYKCKEETRQRYCNKKVNMKDFWEFLFPDPQRNTKVKVRENDKFYKLKKSNSAEELKKEYYTLAKQYHPDKPSGSTKLFQKLKQIYDILLEKYAY